jgi:hypothetical protein
MDNFDKDDEIVSKIGGAVRAAMAAKTALADATAEAIDSASTFGYELGSEDMKVRIIELFENSDSACSGWAIGLIQEKL